MQASVSEFDFLKRGLSGLSNDCEVEGQEREAFDLSDSRLGFRPFAAVEHHAGDLLLTDYPAAHPPLSSPLLTDHLAANPIASPDSSPSLLPETGRVTMEVRFSNSRTSRLGRGFQQPVVNIVTLPQRDNQQHFSLTPSELTVPLLCHQSMVGDSSEKRVVITFLRATSGRKVTR